jgi:exopolysaccharide production protein ExoQ
VCIASLAWSQYPSATLAGIAATVSTTFGAAIMAKTITFEQFVRALGVALRWIIGLSLVFETFVALVIGRPVLPLWVTYDEPIPNAFYWSQGLLFSGDRIQGIVGNANLLGVVALIGMMIFAVQLLDHTTSTAAAWGWLGAASLCFVLARSATMIVALGAVTFALGVILIARRVSSRVRREVYAAAFVIGTTLLALFWTFRGEALGMLERSDDLTGRLSIWDSVWRLASERPVLGWGWVSYWAPWVEPFDDLVVIGEVTYLQAHNAFIDVWFQIGMLGLGAFLALIIVTALRCVAWSIDPPLGDAPNSRAARTLPTLLMTMLLVQSLAESRILVEAGLLLLVYLSTASKSRNQPPPFTASIPLTPRRKLRSR